MTGSRTEDGRCRCEKTTAVKRIGAVSPAARPIERIAPVMMPGAAGASTTRRIVCHRVAPSAREPSRSPCGTCRSASSVVRMIVGRIISPSVTRPASSETPKLRKRTRKVKPKRPKTIEGVPFSRSTAFRMTYVSRFSRWYSAR